MRPSSKFEGYNKVHNKAYFFGSLGYGSYIGSNSLVLGRIGRYCSIADNVVFLTKTHPITEFVSTHPAFYSLKRQCGMTFAKEQMFDEEPCYQGENVSIIVGNDVYIGYGAVIIGPCRIGDGAVVAAGSVVTKDIEPFTIVGGVPAKEIRKRFSDEQIAYVKQLKWWDKSKDWLEEHVSQFDSIEKLMNSG